MKIAVCGQGFVGRAVSAVLGEHHVIEPIDPLLHSRTVEHVEVDGVVACVPTPQGVKGECDVSYIAQVLDTVEDTTPVLIKSTTSISGWSELVRAYPKHDLVFNPEFLRQNTAEADYRDSREHWLGGTTRAVSWWTDRVFQPVFPNAVFHHVTVEEAILIKYLRNSFLATKVVWFNQAHDLAVSEGVSWDVVRTGVADDPRIGHSHTEVTAQRGYGGACFPKDVAALLADYDHPLVESAHKWNSINRKDDSSQ